MGQEGFLLRHEVLGAAAAVPQNGTTYPDLAAARIAADELWWTADARASHQSIVDLATGQVTLRRPDGSWATASGTGRGSADAGGVVDVRSERGWRPFRGRGTKTKVSG